MTMQLLTSAQASPEVPINENFETLSHQSTYGKRHAVSTGLTWGYYGGTWGGLTVADGTVTLTNAATNYLVVLRSTGALSASTSTANWLNLVDYARAYLIVTASSVVTAATDYRVGPGGALGSAARERRINSQSAAYTMVLADSEMFIFHPAADTTARTWTIPANSAVAYPIGTEIEFIVENASGIITIAITTDTLRLAGSIMTGSRVLMANGHAIAKKVTATSWLIRGTGLT